MEKKRKKPASTTSFEVKPNPTAAESLITQPQQLPSYMSNTGGQAATHTQRKTADISFMQINTPVELLGARRNSLGCKSQTTRTKATTLLPQKLHRGFTGIRDTPPSLSSPGETRRRSQARNTGTPPFEGGEPRPASATIFTDMSTFLHTTSSSCLKEETNQVLN